MYPEETIDQLEQKVKHLEELLVDFLRVVANAEDLVLVRAAAGMALEDLVPAS